MTIKTKLRTIALLPLLVFFLAIAIQYWTHTDLNRRYQKRQLVGQISLVNMRLSTLAYEFGISRSEETASQWSSLYAEMGRLHQEMEVLFDSPAEQSFIKDLHRCHQTVGNLFAELILEDKTPGSETQDLPRVRLRDNILNRIILELQGVLPLTERMYAGIDEVIQRSVRQGAFLTVAVILALALSLLFLSLWVVNRISRFLSNFRKGLETVAGGDLTYRINLQAGDELGDLARRFDEMTEQLALVTVPRDELAKETAERRQAQERLTARGLQFNEAQRIARIGSWTLEISSNTLFWSEEIYRIFEIDPRIFGANYEAFLNAIHPEDREMVNQAYTQSLETRQPYDIEHRLLMADGRIKFVRERCETHFDADGKPLRSLGTVQDITEHRQAEEIIRQLHEQLELRVVTRTRDLEEKSAEVEATQRALMNIVEDLNHKTQELEEANFKLQDLDRLKSMFIAAMSHELRTPLNSIIGFSSIVQEEWLGPLNQEQKDKLAIVLRTGKHLLSLINDLIDVSKIEAGKVEIAVDEFDLYDLIVEAATLAEADLTNRGIKLEVEAIHQILHSDRRRLYQCVVNVLGNAGKFTRQGMISIKARLVQSPDVQSGQKWVAISISDTGIGIREEDLPKLFGSFVRLTLPEDMQVKGTGLGLYLVKKIVTDVLGGKVSVASVYGQGSEFCLTVPVK